jgi:hypothetical protein
MSDQQRHFEPARRNVWHYALAIFALAMVVGVALWVILRTPTP